MIGVFVRERKKEGQDACCERIRSAQNHLQGSKSASAAQLPSCPDLDPGPVCRLYVSGAPPPWTLQEVPA